jgi:hypothetical protein
MKIEKAGNMKAITTLQPWASLIACGAKKIEIRSWATRYREKIAIHAGKGFDHYSYKHLMPLIDQVDKDMEFHSTITPAFVVIKASKTSLRSLAKPIL